MSMSSLAYDRGPTAVDKRAPGEALLGSHREMTSRIRDLAVSLSNLKDAIFGSEPEAPTTGQVNLPPPEGFFPGAMHEVESQRDALNYCEAIVQEMARRFGK